MIIASVSILSFGLLSLFFFRIKNLVPNKLLDFGSESEISQDEKILYLESLKESRDKYSRQQESAFRLFFIAIAISIALIIISVIINLFHDPTNFEVYSEAGAAAGDFIIGIQAKKLEVKANKRYKETLNEIKTIFSG